MVQTRRQSRETGSVVAADGLAATPVSGTEKRANTEVDSPASRGRKRRKVGQDEDTGTVEGPPVIAQEEPTALTVEEPPASAKDVKGVDKVTQNIHEANPNALKVEPVASTPKTVSRPEHQDARPEQNGDENVKEAPAAHIRFGSEEPVELSTLEIAPPVEPMTNGMVTIGGEDDESEDEAPEAESLATGLQKAKARSLEASRAAGQQEAAAREKRKRRDSRLKTQADSSKRKKRPGRDKGFNDFSSVEGSGRVPVIPTLLPDEILAREPIVRPPTPPSPDQNKTKSKPHKFFESETRHPKDFQRGSVKVRVMETSHGRLAPKVGKASKSLKESWLAGRQGRKGEGGFERRKIGGGFLRR